MGRRIAEALRRTLSNVNQRSADFKQTCVIPGDSQFCLRDELADKLAYNSGSTCFRLLPVQLC